MARKTTVLIALVALAIGHATTSTAQTLAEVARTEEARRKDVAAPGKVYTNSDLTSDFTQARPAAVSGTSEPEPASAAAVATAKPAGKDEATPAKHDEKYWKALMAAAQVELDRSRTFADALQSRINALTNDAASRDDPFQRAVIVQDRLKALAELDRVKKDIDDQTRAIAKIEEDARKAGAPPGWLR